MVRLGAGIPDGDDRVDRSLADVLDRGHAEADRLGDAVRIGLDGEVRERLLDVRHPDLDAQVPALGDDGGDLLGAAGEAVQHRGHELDRVVRLQVGRLVGDEPVAGGVSLVEAIACEWLEGGEDLVDDVRRNPLLLRAGLELRLVLAEDILLLLADRVAEVVRLRTGVVRHRDGGGHDVLLVDEDPVRVLQRRLEGGVEVGDRLLAVLAADVGGNVRHRPRAEEGDHGGQVADFGRLELLDVSAHPRALQLEDAHRVAAAEQLEGLRVIQWQIVDVELDRPMRPYQLDGLRQDCQVDEAQEVELQQAERLAGVHLELGHRGLAIGRALERHDLGQRVSADDDPRGMGRGVPRHPFQLLCDRDQLVDPIVPGHQLPQLRRGFDGAVEADVQLVRYRLRDPVGLAVGQAHRPADIADGGLRAERPEGDDLRHPVVAVLARDVLDDFVAAAVLEVDVDIRHRHPVRVEEALERQAVLERVDRGDAERVRHDGSRRAAAAGRHDPPLPGEADEIGHDQEVRAVTHPIDDPELVVEPVADLIGKRRVTLP